MKKVIALDIGGTNTRLALINERYEIEAKLIRPTVTGNLDAFLNSVISIIEDGVPSFDGVIAIAMGVPGRVRIDGYIDALPNIGIEKIPLAETIEKHFHLPSFVKNDAEVAALSEANVGPYKDVPSLYFVTISTGVGGALTRKGELVNSTYEVGHTMTEYKGEIHEFEHMVSGAYLPRLAKRNGIEVASTPEFMKRVKEKDPALLPVYEDWIALLADWFKMLHRLFKPDLFAVTGGVMKSKDVFFEDLKKAAYPCRIEECGCGQDAGLLGAAVYGFQKA